MAANKARAVTLPQIVDLDSLDEIRDGMLDAVDHGDVNIDASQVERVATNGLIMLLSAAETARRSSHQLNVTNASEPMLSAIDRLGLGPSFAPLIEG